MNNFISTIQVANLIVLSLFGLFYLYKKYVQKKHHGAYFLPTTKIQIETILEFLKDSREGKMVDLGSGDGRIVLALAKKNFKITGYEINKFLYFISKIKLSACKDHTKIYLKSFWDENLSEYNVVIFFGIEHMLPELENKLLKELKPNSKIISIKFPLAKFKLLKKENNVYFYSV